MNFLSLKKYKLFLSSLVPITYEPFSVEILVIFLIYFYPFISKSVKTALVAELKSIKSDCLTF